MKPAMLERCSKAFQQPALVATTTIWRRAKHKAIPKQRMFVLIATTVRHGPQSALIIRSLIPTVSVAMTAIQPLESIDCMLSLRVNARIVTSFRHGRSRGLIMRRQVNHVSVAMTNNKHPESHLITFAPQMIAVHAIRALPGTLAYSIIKESLMAA